MQVLSEKSDFMRIRSYIVNTISTHAPTPVKFPPLRALAEKFDVSKPTALRVIRSLIEDKYLLPCKGGGTISNPERCSADPVHKIFGLIPFHGDQTYDDLYFNQILSALKLEITSRDASFATVQLNYGAQECFERALVDNVIDYLLFVSPAEGMEKQLSVVRKLDLPAVSCMHVMKGIPSIFRSFPDVCRMSLGKLFAEGRRKILFYAWGAPYYVPGLKESIASAIAEAGLKKDSVTLIRSGNIVEFEQIVKELEERIKNGEKFDGAVFYPFPRQIYMLLKKYFDLKNECRVIADMCAITRDLDYSGYVIESDLKGMAVRAVDFLLEPPESPEQIPIDFDIIEYKTN